MTRAEFPAPVKRAIRERSGGTCEVHLIGEEMRRVRYPALPTDCIRRAEDIDHIHGAWSDGPPTVDNGAYLCKPCHKIKTVTDNKEAKKTARLRGETGQTKRRKERGSTISQPPVSPLSKDHPRYRKRGFGK